MASNYILKSLYRLELVIHKLFSDLHIWEKITSSGMPQIFGRTIRRIKTNKKQIALTYDDGPDAMSTPILLDLLKAYDAKATFFVVGKNIKGNEEIAERIVQEGHDVGNHSWSHAPLICKKPEDVLSEMLKTDSAIIKLGYKRRILFRAPYGRKLFVLPYLLSKYKRCHIYWNIAPGDWNQMPIGDLIKSVPSKINAGSIILLHDGNMTVNNSQRSYTNTIELTRMLLDKYTKLGYKFVTVDSLII